MVNLPQEQNAAVRQGNGHDATAPVKKVEVPQEPGPGQILCKINWSGLCASDKSLIHDEWAGFGVKMQESTKGIAGHEGAGTVAAVHPDVRDLWKVGFFIDGEVVRKIYASLGLGVRLMTPV